MQYFVQTSRREGRATVHELASGPHASEADARAALPAIARVDASARVVMHAELGLDVRHLVPELARERV